MVNTHVVQRLTAIQQSLLAQHAGSSGLPTAMSGHERETFLREFLQKVFPAHRRFSTGAVTDARGAISGQVDIAVEYGFAPSFPMPGTDDRLLLADALAMVIEVKSNLINQWSQVEMTTNAIKRLHRDVGVISYLGTTKPSEQIPVVAVGYRGHATVDALTARLASTEDSCRPDGALVIDSGCFVGFGLTASGPLGLFAMTSAIDFTLGHLITARPNLLRYVTQSEDD